MKAQLDKFVDHVIASLEKGVAPWRQGWANGNPVIPMRSNGEPFTGINHLVLTVMGDMRGYSAPAWFTFQQALKIDACVRKGETGTQALLFNTTIKEGDEGEADKIRRYAKVYTVFNAEQLDNVDPKYLAPQRRERPPVESFDRLIERFPAKVIHRGDRAYYSHTHDHIVMPHYETFESYEEYVGTFLHEAAHAAGAVSRLNRSDLDRTTDLGRSTEEMVAEMAALKVATLLNLPPSKITMDNHMSYLGYWASIVKNDRDVIYRAASLADKAASYIMSHIATEAPATIAEPELV